MMPKILLVEDNEMNRDMLSRRLERKGYEIVIAVDGGEGLELARSAAPDLILMDMSLPVVDGWEATRRLKAAPEERRSLARMAMTRKAPGVSLAPGGRAKPSPGGAAHHSTPGGEAACSRPAPGNSGSDGDNGPSRIALGA